MPAGSAAFSGGDGQKGIEQLIGNAREWTATLADTSAAGATLLRGNWNGRDRVPAVAVVGGGYEDAALTVPKSPIAAEPNGADNETGFRCVAAA